MAAAGCLVDRFGPSLTLGTGLLFGAACTVLLGFGVGTVALAATATALVGLFLGIAGSGSIAIAAVIYPTAIRATGLGWGIGIGRGGQFVLPLIASWLLTRGDGQNMLMVIAAMLVTSIVAVLLLGRATGRARLALAAAGPDAASP
jgi:AAHS family 4-hydroxybenzoate transporter-like MFS transporter